VDLVVMSTTTSSFRPTTSAVDLRQPDPAAGLSLRTLPMLVFSLPQCELRHANDEAAELFGLDLDALRGIYAADLVERVAAAGADTGSMATMSAGAIGNFRARRRLLASSGSASMAWIWARRVPAYSGGFVVWTLLPIDAPTAPTESETVAFWWSGTQLAAGTLGADASLGWAMAADPNIGAPGEGSDASTLGAWVHPADRQVLWAAHGEVLNSHRSVSVAVRLWHHVRGWVDADALLVGTGSDDPHDRVAFVCCEPVFARPSD
jgi:hypothetical protein